MPKIKAFRGWRPAPDKVLEVVIKPFDTFYTAKARTILLSNPYSFLHTIEPLIDNPYMRGSREEIIFKKAKEHFDEFTENGVLVQDPKPAIYIYRTINRGVTQTGIWTCTALDDYLDNTLKKHEYTRADREKDLIEYLQNTGIDANPVLVTYMPKPEIAEIIAGVTAQPPHTHFFADEQEHFLWKLDDEQCIQQLVSLFAELPGSYIADGHHRAAASSLSGIERRKNNLRHRGNEEYNYFSTLYFSTDQLIIFEFQRLVKDLNGLSEAEFIQKLEAHFELKPSDASKPGSLHQFKLYLEDRWYELKAKPHTFDQKNPVQRLDVSILQDYVLEPVLGISNPRTDQRIRFVGGVVPVEDVQGMVDRGEMKVAFVLHPTSIEELIEVADSGNVMPPKSTWFEPKLHCGLVVHQVD
jgi:uncharacterized protein (DUF1015 family)